MSVDHSISEACQEIVFSELKPGERIHWVGQPIPRWFTGGSISFFLFGLVWTAFSIFWVIGAAGGIDSVEQPSSSSIWFPLFGVPFVLIGFGMLSSPLRTRRKMGKTFYALTNQRAIIIVDGRLRTVRSYEPYQLRQITRVERRDGSGSLLFGACEGGGSREGHDVETGGFFEIHDVRDVEKRVQLLAGPDEETGDTAS